MCSVCSETAWSDGREATALVTETVQPAMHRGSAVGGGQEPGVLLGQAAFRDAGTRVLRKACVFWSSVRKAA